MIASAKRPLWAVIVLLSLTATACGQSPSASPTTEPGSATTATSAPAAAPGYPTTPQAYAEAVLAAWKANDLNQLGDLTTTQVYNQIVGIPGPPNQDWAFRDCEDDATVYCGFFNAVGDWITIRIDKDKLGAADAASALEFEPTVYPDDAVEYVQAFVAAWQFGNKARMLALSKSDVVDQLDLGSPPDFESYPTPTCCGGGLVQVVVEWGGDSVTFDVGSTLLGMPHAIVGYAP